MKIKSKFVITSLVCTALSAGMSQAAITFFEDFNSATGTLPRGFVNTDSSVLTDINGAGLRELGSHADPFGRGASDINLAVGNNNLRLRTTNAVAITNLTTVSFDFFEPAGGGDNLIRFGFGNQELNGLYAAFVWSFNNGVVGLGDNTTVDSGALPTFSLDRHYIVSMMLNETGAAATIEGLSTADLAAGEAALFFWDVENETMIEGGRFTSSKPTNANNFVIRSFSAETKQTVYIDNFTVRDTLTAVPEPHFTSLLGAFAILALARRARK